MLKEILFVTTSTLATLSASMVVLSKNPVRSALFLVLTFFLTSIIWMLLETEYLAISLILVYVGAVMVLFLFVVMMLDIELAEYHARFVHFFPLGVFVALCIIGGTIMLATGPAYFNNETFQDFVPRPKDYSNVKQLGEVLYTKYLYSFEYAAVILLVSMISAIGLAFRGIRQEKRSNISEQVKVSKSDRLRIVSTLDTLRN